MLRNPKQTPAPPKNAQTAGRYAHAPATTQNRKKSPPRYPLQYAAFAPKRKPIQMFQFKFFPCFLNSFALFMYHSSLFACPGKALSI